MILLFVETPRKIITAELSIRKLFPPTRSTISITTQLSDLFSAYIDTVFATLEII